jgi:hypothetical protein
MSMSLKIRRNIRLTERQPIEFKESGGNSEAGSLFVFRLYIDLPITTETLNDTIEFGARRIEMVSSKSERGKFRIW